ncbi:hypothetical protein FHW77_002913 [Agrobacterium sp. RC10-4-1]|uniref:hypothetical protein n=1 Tax=Agrobacterium sp. RC10-4-1 TaxID=2587039 RepID=UPI0015F9F766|nr:hypothetical protein [Agrobacterium sp. RC10-4-1]MBA8799194.1 hypothetical protein [Agrobacterium sp. RC10-4-1]
MAFVTRYRIEDGARFFNGTEFTTDENDVFEYRSEGEANDDADEFGGEVVKFSRYAQRPDIVLPSQWVEPIVIGANLQAAE